MNFELNASKLFFIFLMFSISIFGHTRPNFSKVKIQVGQKIITVELADTPEKTAYGLMFKKTLGENEGMLFIFQKEQPLSFWMKNTFIDLSIAYFDTNKTIVDIIEMKSAKSELQSNFESYNSSKPAQYALELNKGWFQKNKIKIGDKFKQLSF